MKIHLFLSILFFIALLEATTHDRVIIAHPKPPLHWKPSHILPDPSELIQFKLLLKQNNLDKLNQYFWEVSNPKSPYYGDFLTSQQVNDLVRSNEESFQQVYQLLGQHEIHQDEIEEKADYILVRTSVERAASLFQAKFLKYKSSKTGAVRVRLHGPATLPSHILDHIDFVTGLSEFMDKIKTSHHNPAKNYDNADKASLNDDILITPPVLKSYYNVPPTEKGSAPSNFQGIAAFSDYFSQGALDQFVKTYSLQTPNVTINGSDCLSGGCDQYESDLDMQYISAMGQGIPILFMAHPDGEWILDYAQSVLYMHNPPLVQSISYGWAELSQCDITNGCSTYGYNSQQYVNRTDVELQKIGSMGISVLVSDGDDGAPSLGGSSGNCPIDPGTYCPTGGCAHTKTQCAELTFSTSDGSLCFFPQGIGSDSCSSMLNDPNLQTAMNAFSDANTKCKLAFESDRTNLPHVYSECACSSLSNVTNSGYTVSAYSFSESNGAIFTSEYPTSSPFVTSVGATQFLSRNSHITQELGCSILEGAKITTGGGFSTFQPQPDYQAKAVASWMANNQGSIPPSFAFNPTMRAYPDISFNGHNYNIFASTNSANFDQCPCTQLPVDGTSCSSPALAGLISLINDKLISAGKSPLGFLNPLLYQMALENPSSFNDITAGSNNCNRSYCCKYGYTATAGWDPVSGIGSPDFEQFEKYILSIKGL